VKFVSFGLKNNLNSLNICTLIRNSAHFTGLGTDDRSNVCEGALLKTVTEQITETYRVKGSKFIGHLFPAVSLEAFEKQLELRVRAHPSASHHCYAWRLDPTDPTEFAQDAGEPSGTAGLPILNQLKSADLINCGCVVSRYFGGTKLGKPGLIEAYGHTASLCISHSELWPLVPTRVYDIRYPYDMQGVVETWRSRYDLVEKDAVYLEEIRLRVACPASMASSFLDELEGSAHLLHDYDELGASYEIGTKR